MNILVCGLYFSGSSALTDLLSEYDPVAVVPGEFDDIRRAGMLGDLVEGKISDANPLVIDAACNGFYYPTKINPTLKYYLKGILKYLAINTGFIRIYKGYYYREKLKRPKLLNKYFKLISVQESKVGKIKTLKNYIKEVVNIYDDKNKEFVLFDQPIFFGSHQELWPEIYDPFKLIVVYRDPRDQIAQLIKNNLILFDIETPTRGLVEIYGNTREGAVRYELDALSARYKNAKKLQEKLGKEKVKLMSFENLVTYYEESKQEIEHYLGLNSEFHRYKKQALDPDVSRKNIGFYQKYLTAHEIKIIENSEFFKEKYL